MRKREIGERERRERKIEERENRGYTERNCGRKIEIGWGREKLTYWKLRYLIEI